MQKLRGYLALGIFIMGIISFLCLLLPRIEITDDALMLMMLAVPPLICGLIIALALHMLLYTLLLVLYGCRIQLVDLYFLQYIRRKTVGWRVQYLPAAERKMSIVMEAVPWEKETGRQQERARTALFYVQSVLAILFSMRWQSICMGQHPPLPALCWRGVMRFSASSCRQAKFGKYSSPKNGAKCGRCSACWRRT